MNTLLPLLNLPSQTHIICAQTQIQTHPNWWLVRHLWRWDNGNHGGCDDGGGEAVVTRMMCHGGNGGAAYSGSELGGVWQWCGGVMVGQQWVRVIERWPTAAAGGVVAATAVVSSMGRDEGGVGGVRQRRLVPMVVAALVASGDEDDEMKVTFDLAVHDFDWFSDEMKLVVELTFISRNG
nr:hypothetical protein [Tanacetum cinerariifolium]